ncbi:polysaccharide pyruvyl transferase family protein [Cryobacterium fucosi]|uniref:Polysaccharide pyruvyl transferase family protein n=1 Tax=Cryobacterium fucosi TaxID=1259157 RepID=A0A4R9BFQ2_9MICO|nr:polysaccharide pyruvyl transferase family protein [Cryobacterium fucosi]TFD82687.1 polysaccharide pyruvyl transferase family protein [Cryobacterium fucosi]
MFSSTPKASVLLIGAYERDNFGDLLFYQLTMDYLRAHEVAAGSVIGADMTSLLGARVHPHNDLLSARSWDLVWVVGGEVGGVDVEGALAMSLDDVAWDIYGHSGAEGRDHIARYLTGAPARSPAYLPILEGFPLNVSTPLVLNSVGLGNLVSEAGSSSAVEARSVIRSAAAIVTRDRTSHEIVTAMDLTPTLSPDMVHAISLLHPDLADSTRISEPYFVFQASAELIARVGEETIARAIALVAVATKWRPALFLAGTARHHDRADQYDGIEALLKAIAPAITPMRITTRRPMQLAAVVAGSRLWIGSSLHGRIIADSFGLPRVSLQNAKVANYAASWDAGFPTNVPFDALVDGVADAISTAQSGSSVEASKALSHGANQATQSLVRDFL